MFDPFFFCRSVFSLSLCERYDEVRVAIVSDTYKSNHYRRDMKGCVPKIYIQKLL